eukprot:gene6897-11059_t
MIYLLYLLIFIFSLYLTHYLLWNLNQKLEFWKFKNLDEEKNKKSPYIPIINGSISYPKGNLNTTEDFLNIFLKESKKNEIFSFWFGCKPCIIISSNEEIKKILKNNQFEKGTDYKEIKKHFYGDCLIGLDDKKEIQMQHQLFKKGLKNFNFQNENLITNLKDGKNLNIIEVTKDIFTKITLEKFFNDFDTFEDELEEFKDSCEVISKSFEENLRNYYTFPHYFWQFFNGLKLQSKNLSKRNSHTTFDLSFHFLLNYSERMMDEIIDGNHQKIDNLIGNLLDLYDVKEENIEEKLKIIDILTTSIFKNIEKTSFITSCCLFELSRNEEIQEKLRNEILNEKKLGLKNDNYLNMVIKETLRLYPCFFAYGRTTKKETQILNYLIPKNTFILLFPYGCQKAEEYFEQPNEFKPERFEKEPKEGYFPFGYGERKCLGEDLVYQEIKIIIQKSWK